MRYKDLFKNKKNGNYIRMSNSDIEFIMPLFNGSREKRSEIVNSITKKYLNGSVGVIQIEHDGEREYNTMRTEGKIVYINMERDALLRTIQEKYKL